MRVDIGRILRDDKSLPSGSAHPPGESDLRDEVVAIDLCQSLSQISQSARQVIPGALQKFDC